MNLPPPLRRILRSVGMDRAIGYTLIAQGWTVVAGPLTLFFLASSLSLEEQGFYYTFGSILGLQVFLELGLGFVLLQFASHEKSQLEWTPQGTLEGNTQAKARLASLLQRALLWYGVVAGLVVLLVLPAGLFFFGRHQGAGVEVAWRGPWVWVVLVAACNLMLTPIYTILEGCGVIAEIALLRMCQNISTSLVSWSLLWGGWKLLAMPAFHTLALVLGLSWAAWRQRRILSDLLKFRHEKETLDWWHEVWPFQWKIALSGISGYFVFLFFNPILFAFQGPVVAGQMGMSTAVLTAFALGAGAWIGTKLAPFGVLVARRAWDDLDRLFFPALWQSVSLVALGGAVFWGVVLYLNQSGHPWSLRILGPLPLGLFVASTVVNHIVGAQALYLRAHKQDPFLPMSLIFGCSVGLSTYFMGRYSDVTGMMAGYFLISLIVGLGGGTWIFQQKRRLWHDENAPDAAELPETSASNLLAQR